MIIFDTTVLVYAKGEAHPLRNPCRRLISAVADRKLEATTTVEVIQEFVHVRARRRSRADAVKLGSDYLELLSPLLTLTSEHLQEGLSIFERTQGLGAFDAVLAAAALRTGAQALISADTSFSAVGNLKHLTPDHAEISELLAN